MTLKPLAIVAAVLSLAATPSFAFYATVTDVNVVSSTPKIDGSTWLYTYLLENRSTCYGSCDGTVQGIPIATYLMGVNTFSIPFFSDAGMFNIASPKGWSHRILAENRFSLTGAGTLEWYATDDKALIARDAGLAGFNYSTSFAPTKGPFYTTFGNGDDFLGDPAIPLSPMAILAGLGQPSAIPEPATGLLMLAALGAFGARRRLAAKAK